MRILAIDVAVSGCNVACFDSQSGQISQKSQPTDRGQAEMLVPMIEACIQDAGWIIGDIERIAVTRGPGSFTGVRIGLATARTLGLALKVPVLGFSTLALMLDSAESKENILAVIDTKRDDYYAASSQQEGVTIMTPDQVNAWSGEVIRDVLPDITLMAQQAAEITKENFDRYDPSPIYVRDAETSTPKSA